MHVLKVDMSGTILILELLCFPFLEVRRILFSFLVFSSSLMIAVMSLYSKQLFQVLDGLL